LSSPVRQRLFIDGTTISAKSQPRLDISQNITFPHVPCYLLHFDAIDPATQLPLPLDEVTSTFTRLSRTDASLGVLPPDFLDSDAPPDCGPRSVGSSGCCRSRQEVFAAHRERGFRPPPLRDAAQCAPVRTRPAAFAGEFRVAPGVGGFSECWHVHDAAAFGIGFDDIKLTHGIEGLRFAGRGGAMPLDGMEIAPAWRAVYTADILGSNFSVSCCAKIVL
jgi:hypothetical protein